METEIYPYRRKCTENHLDVLRASSISDRNKELITQYLEHLSTKNAGKYRQGKLAYQLLRICQSMKSDLDTAEYFKIQGTLANFNDFSIFGAQKTKKENGVQRVITVDRHKPISEATKADYKRALKSFYLWFEVHDSRLDSDDKRIRKDAQKLYTSVKNIKTSFETKEIDPTEVITEEDISIILSKGCRTPKEKAFISLLHETGARTGEMLGMKVKHFKVNGQGIGEVFFPISKTKPRSVDIIDSVGHIIKYLDVHPAKQNEEAPMWYQDNIKKKRLRALEQEHGPLPLRHTGATNLVKDCMERAGIKKKHNLHWFRHSRASLDATELTPDVRCVRMGWSPGSKQLNNYTHLGQKQIREAYLKSKGIVQEDEKSKPKRCSVCNAPVKFDEDYCPNCYRPLSIKIHLKNQEILEEETNDTIKAMMELLKNPEIMKKFEEFKKAQK